MTDMGKSLKRAKIPYLGHFHGLLWDLAHFCLLQHQSWHKLQFHSQSNYNAVSATQ
jgi:hypothetical protein